MKPTEPDIAWCIENAEFVNGLLEKRGGWQVGDWCADVWSHKTYLELIGEPPADFTIIDANTLVGIDHIAATWLPSVDDVLAMLEDGGVTPNLASDRGSSGTLSWSASGWHPSGMTGEPERSGWQKTPLIALLELLEGKG